MTSTSSGNTPLAPLKYNSTSTPIGNSGLGSFSNQLDSSLTSSNFGTSTISSAQGTPDNPVLATESKAASATSTNGSGSSLPSNASAIATATPAALSVSTNPGNTESLNVQPGSGGTISTGGGSPNVATNQGFSGSGINVNQGTPIPSNGNGSGINVNQGTPIPSNGNGSGINVNQGTPIPSNGNGSGINVNQGTPIPSNGNSSGINVNQGTPSDNGSSINITEGISTTANVNGSSFAGSGIKEGGSHPHRPYLQPKVVSVSDANAIEGQKEIFTVGLSKATMGPTQVTLNLSGGSATPGSDFTPELEASFDGGGTWQAVTNNSITVGAGVKNFQVRSQTIDDMKVEPTETFTLSANGNGGNATGTGTIIDNDRQAVKAQLVGDHAISEGSQGSYSVTLDTVSNQDRFFSVAANDGSAKRFSGDGSGQDFVWGGAYDIKRPLTVFQDRVPNDNVNGFNNRAAVGAGNASQDYTLYDSRGQISSGNTVTVKVAAGQTKSEQFAVKAWQEKVTVDLDYSNPNGLNATNYQEGTENFSLRITDAGDAQVTNGNLDVAINDRTHYNLVSPIAIDLNGDGIKTVGIEQGVTFDMLNSGQKVTTGWISGDDGLLAIDHNGNGKIDSRHELFGGSVGDGFAKLASFDSNKDGVVDGKDNNFSSLKIWQDVNVNGITDASELMSLATAGIGSVNVAHTTDGFSRDAQNNLLGERGSAVALNGNSLDAIDVYFQVNG
jgi:hypothetical protein